MAKVSYIEGIQCKLCGKILQGNRGAEITTSTPELCQNCGAHLVDMDMENRTYNITSLGRPVIIKATHKLFTTYYEVVREVLV